MVVPAVTDGTARSANREPAAVKLVARAIPEFGGLIYDLTGERWEEWK